MYALNLKKKMNKLHAVFCPTLQLILSHEHSPLKTPF